MGNGDPIIIRGGGSIEITLYNPDRKITRVAITDEDTNQTTECPIPDSGKFTLRIEHTA